METFLATNWNSLTLDKYDGTTNNLDEHINMYVTQVSLYTTDDIVLCWVFPNSLKGKGLSRFTRLPERFIDTFKTLVTRFGI